MALSSRSLVSGVCGKSRSALIVARKKQADLISDFLALNKKPSDFIYRLQDLDSINSADDLADRVEWLKKINSYLSTVRVESTKIVPFWPTACR